MSRNQQLRRIFPLLLFTTPILGSRYFQQPTDLPSIDYDFIIVGGGTAGGVVGSRLGEVPNYNILVIEAGPSNDEVFDVQVPGLAHGILFGTSVDWNFTTAPQTSADGRVLEYSRSKILGGCSSHNDMVYTRGSRDDYDRWAKTADDDSLSWAEIYPYILKTEKWSAPNDPSLSEQGHFDPAFHNDNGKIGVTAPYFPHEFNNLLFEAAGELSGEFPFLKDLNDGRPIGLGWSQSTTAHGLRSSSATGYLAHASDNVHVLLNSLVTRILPVQPGNTSKVNGQGVDFRRVEVTTGPESAAITLTAKKEVILSAGMIKSPQILLLSGIGPKDELDALGIDTLVDNQSVGKNFSDQPAFPLGYSTNLEDTANFNLTTALAQWNLNHTGMLALSAHLPPVGWVRFPPDSKPFQDGSADPTAGPNSPHVELFFIEVDAIAENNITFVTAVVNVNPTSRGSITLASSSPFDDPIIDPAILSSSIDIAILVEGFMSTQRLMTSNAFSKNIFGLTSPTPTSNGTISNDELIAYIRSTAEHNGHGVATCSIAPHGASWGVVDPEFRVRDTQGLRVVDASVIPFVTSGHTQAPVYAIAEKASDVIKQTYV